jgi:predicted nucleic acid-binding protein
MGRALALETAVAHGMTAITRDVADFKPSDVLRFEPCDNT